MKEHRRVPKVELCEDEDYDLHTCSSPNHVQEPGEEAYNVQPPHRRPQLRPRTTGFRAQHERAFTDVESLNGFGGFDHFGFGGLGGFGDLDLGFGSLADGFFREFGGLTPLQDLRGFEDLGGVSASGSSLHRASYKCTTIGRSGGHTASRTVYQEYTPEGGFKEQVFSSEDPRDAFTQREDPRLLPGRSSRRSFKVPVRTRK